MDQKDWIHQQLQSLPQTEWRRLRMIARKGATPTMTTATTTTGGNAMNEQPQVPAGYRKDHQGRLVPEDLIKPIDKTRDELVTEIVSLALPKRDELAQFKQKVIGDILAFIDLSAEQYNVKLGGKKGNVTLLSFDGRYKVALKIREHTTFDERIEAAKQLIDNCLNRWTEDSRPEIKAIVERAFRTNHKNQLRTAEVLGLKNLNIEDDEWMQAMKILMDSLAVTGSTLYVNIHERIGDTEKWDHIAVGLAGV